MSSENKESKAWVSSSGRSGTLEEPEATAQEICYQGIRAWAVPNKYIIHWIPENITPLIGGIYALACGTRVNTKPTNSWYSPVSNE